MTIKSSHEIQLWDQEIGLFKWLIVALIARVRSGQHDYVQLSENTRITIGGVEFAAYRDPTVPFTYDPRDRPSDTIIQAFGDSPWLLRMTNDRNPCGIVPREARLEGDRAAFDRDVVMLKMFAPANRDIDVL